MTTEITKWRGARLSEKEQAGRPDRPDCNHQKIVADEVGINHQGNAEEHRPPEIHSLSVDESDEADLKNEDLPPEARAKLERLLREPSPPPLPAASLSPAASAVPATSSAPAAPTAPPKQTFGPVTDRPFVLFDADTKPSTPFEKWIEARAKEKFGEHGTKFGLFLSTLFSNLPYMMLCCIPLFAFVLKVLYVRRHIFYIDHLIYALHIHTFAYTGIMLIVLATIGLNRAIPGTFAGWMIALLWIAFVVQIFLSIRRVYRQSWFISTLKFFTGGFIYLFVLAVALAATFFITVALP